MLWTNEVLQDLSLRRVSEGYPKLQQQVPGISPRNQGKQESGKKIIIIPQAQIPGTYFTKR